MSLHRQDRTGVPWLELLLAASIASLILQLFPSVWAALDVRIWSRTTWIVLNLLVVAGLILFREEQSIFESVREFSQQRAAKKAKFKQDEERRLKNAELQEQRKLYERMREARKRQIV